MEGKKNYFEATTKKEAEKIVRRMKAAGFSQKAAIDFDHIFYPCRFYNNAADQIVLDYTPFGGWKSFAEFVGSWMERPNNKKLRNKI